MAENRDFSATSLIGAGPPTFTSGAFNIVGHEVTIPTSKEHETVVHGRFKEIIQYEHRLAVPPYTKVKKVLGLEAWWDLEIKIADATTARILGLVYNKIAQGYDVWFRPAHHSPRYSTRIQNEGDFPLENVDGRKAVGMKISMRFSAVDLVQGIELPPSENITWRYPSAFVADGA